jgi:two-component system nitrogen regulation sensor histidine kinase NtrY
LYVLSPLLKKIFRNRLFLFAAAALLLGTAQLTQVFRKDDPWREAQKIEQVLHQKEERAQRELNLLSAQASQLPYNQLFAKRPEYYNSLFKDKGLVLLLYQNDTLKFWSDNSVAVENYMKEVCLDDRMAKLKNGWFEVVKQHVSASLTAVALIHIKSEYPYQNPYLINSFQKDFNLVPGTRLLLSDPPGLPAIRNTKTEYLFSIQTAMHATNTEKTIGWFQLLVSSLGLFLLLLALKSASEAARPRFGETISILIFACSLLASRWLTIRLHFPAGFYDATLFGPQYYGDARSFWLHSLGDFFLNALLIFYFTFYLSRNWKADNSIFNKRKVAGYIFAFLIFLSLFWFSWLIDGLFKGLIHNSEIAFNVNELFGLNAYSILGIITIGFLLFAFFLYADKALSLLLTSGLDKRKLLLVFLPALLLHIIICHLTGLLDLVAILWSFFIIAVIARIKLRSIGGYSFSGSILLVMILSMYSVHTFLKHTQLKENDNRKVYAEKLATEPLSGNRTANTL